MDSFCSACGTQMAAGERFCRVCGKDTGAVTAAPPQGLIAGSAATSSKAIASLVCGLLFFIPLAFVAAIVFGHMALSEIRKSAGRLKGDGLAIAGLVLGYMWIVAIPIILIVAAIAIPNLLRARMAANEASAVSNIRTLFTAEMNYAAAHQQAGFTCSLADLSAEHLISSRLAGGEQAGYVFELQGCSSGASGMGNTHFEVVAHPVRANQTGVRAFCADETSVIKVEPSGSSARCAESGEPLQ